MGPSPTYHPPEGEECETSVEHGLPLSAEPAVGYCSQRPRPSPMWGIRFVGAHAVGPGVGEQKPHGKTPLRGNPSPKMTYLPTLCQVFQAVKLPHQSEAGKANWTPLPDVPMESVVIDKFAMAPVPYGKSIYDCVILCVDRHDEYLVAVPARNKGLTAEAVARQMIRHWIMVFRTPKAIFSDNVCHFTGAFFRTIGPLMGVRDARILAYHSQSNGRAEVAGCQLFEQLKKLHLKHPGRNWPTSMWRAIQAYHHLPTPSGYSPHQILFGRDLLEQGVQWATPGKALDSEEFMANVEEMAAKVTEALTKEHEKRRHYQEKAPVAKYKVGNTVWLDRPSKLSEDRQAT